jgi:hypothetical protein
MGAGTAAQAEFQKIVEHRGRTFWFPFHPLAQLGLARAAALRGDTAGTSRAYQTFFTLWKDADADLPVVVEARKEYARLRPN